VLSGLAHTAVCVPDVEAAVRWYSEVLGLQVLSPPYTMQGAQIERDMGELVPPPVVVTAAIVGFGKDDRVIELIEYPAAGIGAAGPGSPSVTRVGITHLGVVCDDLAATRSELQRRGVMFLTKGIADVAGLRTAWCSDPWGTVIILMEKRDASRAYWSQIPAPHTAQPGDTH
jgi:methylmalonyl-CoA/ethylmalonyl-CoA epimerase